MSKKREVGGVFIMREGEREVLALRDLDTETLGMQSTKHAFLDQKQSHYSSQGKRPKACLYFGLVDPILLPLHFHHI